MKKVIVTLVKGADHHNDYSFVILRNKFIEENLNSPCDVLIFHEGDIPLERQHFIRSKTNLPVNFLTIPKFEAIPGIEFDKRAEGFGWSYRRMCSFWFVDFMKYLDGYDLVLRIDDDCIIRSNIDDIFKELSDKVCVYGEWSGDGAEVTIGLNQFSLDNINTNKEPKQGPSGPYTNMVGLNLKKIRDKVEVLDYIDKVKQSNNIFIYRWGDLPLWGEVLYYFFEPEEYMKLPIKYYHGSHKNFINW